jgi:hypothetical protein
MATDVTSAGRPRKPINSKRSVVRRLFLTPLEWARIQRDAQALGLTEPDLIREGALSYRRLSGFVDAALADAEKRGNGRG